MSTNPSRKILMLRNCPEVGNLIAAIEALDPERDTEVLVEGGLRLMGNGNEWIRTSADACPDAVLMCLDASPNEGRNPWCWDEENTGEWFLKRWEDAINAFPQLATIPRILLHWSKKCTQLDPQYFFRILNFDCHNRDVLRALRDALVTTSKKSGQIFLSYSREDEQVARDIYSSLNQDGFQIWFDQVNLSPGQDWEFEITRAIRKSIAFVMLISSRSISKRGYFQKEIRRSLEVAEETPEGDMYIIPVKLDDCEVPESIKKYHWCQYQESSGYNQLRLSLEKLISDYSQRKEVRK